MVVGQPGATVGAIADNGSGRNCRQSLGTCGRHLTANIADLSPHDLRHRFGYRMAQTVPLHRLAQIMGHDSLDTTMIYVQGTKQDLQRAVEEIAWM